MRIKILYDFKAVFLSFLVFVAFLSCTEVTNEPDKLEQIPSSGETLLPNIPGSQFVLEPDFLSDSRQKLEEVPVKWEHIERVLQQAQDQTNQELVAVFSVRDDSSDTGYRYYLQPLRFSRQAMREANEETQLFIYESNADYKGSVPRIAVAIIPQGQVAYEEMEAWILPKSGLEEDSQNQQLKQSSGCEWEYVEVAPAASVCWAGGCTYYPALYDLEYICSNPDGGGPDGGGGGDPTWNWPDEPDNGGQLECPPPLGCGDPCDEPNPPVWCTNSCQTEDPIIDNTAVQEVFEYLIEKSDLDLPIEQRTEQGGFIVEDPITGRLGLFELPNDWVRYACGINPPSNWLNSVPDNTVAFVHSHPFFEGEDTTHPNVCGEEGSESYNSGTNIWDIDFLNQISGHLNDYTIKGYVIDGSNIVTYNVLQAFIDEDERCGY